jgi:cytochrome P450
MTTSPEPLPGPEIDFDHFSPELNIDPYPVYKNLRETCPVARATSHGGWWLVTSHRLADEVVHHPETFSSHAVSVPRVTGEAEVAFPPLNYDPPEHGPWKRLLTAGLGPKRAASLEDVTRTSAVSLIDTFLHVGKCDAAMDFAQLVPIAVLCRLLGLPEGQEQQFGAWVRQNIDHGDDPDVVAQGFIAVRECIAAAVEARRSNLGDDMISFLMTSELGGRPLSEEEVLLVGMELFLAGVDTTFNVLGSTIHYLATHLEEQRALRNNPDRLDVAREEFLRAFAPVMIGREVKHDVVLGGCGLQTGDMLLVALGSACRDEQIFPDGEKVHLDRAVNPHLAFGLGLHRCVGSHVARMELSIALYELLTRVPEFRLDEERAVKWSVGPIRGPRFLPIRFAAAT